MKYLGFWGKKKKKGKQIRTYKTFRIKVKKLNHLLLYQSNTCYLWEVKQKESLMEIFSPLSHVCLCTEVSAHCPNDANTIVLNYFPNYLIKEGIQ